jgi:hypothetical protein
MWPWILARAPDLAASAPVSAHSVTIRQSETYRHCEKLSELVRPEKGLFQPASPKLRLLQPLGPTGAQLMAKQLTITIETQSLFILRGRSTTRQWCPLCDAEVEMIAFQNTGTISNDEKAFDDWLNTGALHRAAAADGAPLICLNSLLARVHNTKPPARPLSGRK